MHVSSIVFGMVLGAASTAMAADLKVDEQPVGPVADKAKFITSPRGVHLATVAPKGSRVNVVVDGVAGPRFDDVVETTFGVIDPRPYVNVDVNSQPHGAAVTFSRDGNRYAYLARLGQEWVLMADNKEVLRLPVTGAAGATSGISGSEGNTDVRIEFSGESGRHLLFTRSTFGGYELWVDGQKWPGLFGSGGGGTEGTIDPIISPDGEHIAYPAQISREKRALIVDGKDAGYFGGHLQFTPDSTHLLSISESPKGQAVLVDGKSVFAAKQVLHVYVPPAGNRLIFAVSKDGSSAEGSFLMVDNKLVAASLTRAPDIVKLAISPDGKHYAAICGSSPNQFVVIDGKKGQEYFSIDAETLATLQTGMSFSADSSKVVYTARSTSGQFVVINDDESDALQNAWFQFSADGKHLAYGGMTGPGMQKMLLSIDGKTLPLPPGWFVSLFTFSPDGARYAFVGQQGGNKGIFLDGKNTELTGDFAFSPDGRHFAVVGFRPAENKSGLFVDGQLIFENYDKALVQRGFTSDSQHLAWMAREPAIGVKAGPGIMEYVVYVDGSPAVRCDSIMDAQGNLRNLYGFSTSPWKMPAGWNTNTAGALTFLGPVDDGMKRFTVATPADTNIDTMIAEAKAAPARAAAKAAEDKKKAADAAAAKKAQADAAAAEAAAKAKADYDAAVAKRKADYDAAIAKRKADYDAAVAKKKADYDAAVAAKAELAKQQQQKK